MVPFGKVMPAEFAFGAASSVSMTSCKQEICCCHLFGKLLRWKAVGVMFKMLASSYKPHETGFHTNFGFLLLGDRAAAVLWIKSIIESFGLVEELFIGQERCLWPNISTK